MRVRGLEGSPAVRDLADKLVIQAKLDGTDRGFLLDVEESGYRCVILKVGENDDHAKTNLSPREHEIAMMVAAGHPNKTIAAVLDISVWTVNTYLRRIFSKMGVNCRAAMVAHLANEGFIGEK
jgi:DNA-binding CsgD family transcriptional regulator